MNRETSAFSYWGFMDDNLLPYKEITDNDKPACNNRVCYCWPHYMDDEKEGRRDSTRREDGDKEACTDTDEMKQKPGEDVDKKRQYKEYHHAVDLAPSLVACIVRPANKL